MPRVSTWLKGQSPDLRRPSAKKDLTNSKPKNRKPVSSSNVHKKKASRNDRRPSRDRSKKSLSDSESRSRSRDNSKVKVKKNPVPVFHTLGALKGQVEGAKGRVESPRRVSSPRVQAETRVEARAETLRRRLETSKLRTEIPRRRLETPKVRVESPRRRTESPKGPVAYPKGHPEVTTRTEAIKGEPVGSRKGAETLKNRAEAFRARVEINRTKADPTKGQPQESFEEPKTRLDTARGREVYQALVSNQRKTRKTENKNDVLLAADSNVPEKKHFRFFQKKEPPVREAVTPSKGLKKRADSDAATSSKAFPQKKRKKGEVSQPELPSYKSKNPIKQLLKRQLWKISKPRLKSSQHWSKLFKDNNIDIDKINIDAVDYTLIDVDGLGIENKFMKRTVAWLLK